MKLHFEDNLDYQQAAVQSVVALFKGQDVCRTEFTINHLVEDPSQETLTTSHNIAGIGNFLTLPDSTILKNLQTIQRRNLLPVSESMQNRNFTVEMETGTGKTYVYLRTIFELNRHYGFTKFVIVVPSIAIKEGVYKTLEITREHFENLYPQAKGHEYFLYDSTKLDQVRNFAAAANIHIMVVTAGAINKRSVNNMYKQSESMNDEQPIQLIRETRPIIIVDEPQSVDGGLKGKGREALDAMMPLCTLRYSATHVDRYHMVYSLDAVDAYERGLVKQIEVASVEIDGGHNKPYVKLISTHSRRGAISAKIEADFGRIGGVRRQIFTVQDGDNLEKETSRELYENYRIGTIVCDKDNKSIDLLTPEGTRTLLPGQEIGGIHTDEIKRFMIRRTIKEHLDKEKDFSAAKRGVKILSLFFIDSVKFYRQHDKDGNIVKGKYALMFEEEYRRFAKQPQYQSLFERVDLDVDMNEIHDGYFSIDRKGIWQETTENNQENRDAERAYNLIMKNKEALLSFDSKLKFIFSHSALKEGWDNPNVFQICALRDMSSETERRQTIGRGLRLCVNQEGNRLRDSNINILTVIATENYERFAEALQKEIEADTGIRFGMVQKHQFSHIVGNKSEQIWQHLEKQGFLNKDGKLQDSLRAALQKSAPILPANFKPQEEQIRAILRKHAGRLDIKNARERISIPTRESILESEDFRKLWERIKHKTTYRVQFDNAQLLEKCVTAVRNSDAVTKTSMYVRTADIDIDKSGISTREKKKSGFTTINEDDIPLPDILTFLESGTGLTRKSLHCILVKSRRLHDFKRNPQEFIDNAVKAINHAKRQVLVDGIRYRRIGSNEYYAQELFKSEELKAYLKNSIKAKKSVYHRTVYASERVEKHFAEDLEKNESVKLYVKLPSWFTIPTPLGSYNPDWAVLVENDGQEKLYFVVETKGSLWQGDLRLNEQAKFECGEKHFEALKEEALKEGVRNPAEFVKATTVDDMLRHT